MLINMREKLLPIQWNMACLDEAHVIKSAHTEIAKTVLQLKATTRLDLTGTPLQNKAIDIWTIFQFLNPGLLGERSSFYSQYASTPQKMEQMRKGLSPFILRRTKKEVLHELPSKTESIIRTEMSSREIQYQGIILLLKVSGHQFCLSLYIICKTGINKLQYIIFQLSKSFRYCFCIIDCIRELSIVLIFIDTDNQCRIFHIIQISISSSFPLYAHLTSWRVMVQTVPASRYSTFLP